MGNIAERLWRTSCGLVQPSYYFEKSKYDRDVPLMCRLQSLIHFLIAGLGMKNSTSLEWIGVEFGQPGCTDWTLGVLDF